MKIVQTSTTFCTCTLSLIICPAHPFQLHIVNKFEHNGSTTLAALGFFIEVCFKPINGLRLFFLVEVFSFVMNRPLMTLVNQRAGRP